MKRLLIILSLLFVLCTNNPEDVFSQEWAVIPDTVAFGDTVSVTMVLKYDVCIKAFGFELELCDTSIIEYLPDSTETYGLFDHEVIDYNPEYNILTLGFSNLDSAETCIQKGQPIFTIYFKLKKPGTCVPVIHDAYVFGDWIKAEWKNFILDVKQFFSNYFIIK